MNWDELSRRYGDRVLLVARSILRDDGLAMDVAQDALLKIGRCLDAEVRNPEAWVLTVAGNAARDALRRKSRRREVAMDNDLVDARRPEAPVLARESRERVTAALEGLPAGARDVLLLKFRENLTGPQIAAALGLSMAAAWQQLSRALKLLKSKLSETV